MADKSQVTLAIQIVSDAKKAIHGMKEAGSAVATLGAGLKKVAAVGVAAGAAAFGGLAYVVKSASNTEQAMGALDAVFKDSKSVMRDHAENAAKTAGLSARAYAEMAAVLGSQLKNGGTALSDLAPKTHQLITLGADLAAMYGGTTKDAVDTLAAALRGERDPIERYGVSLNQAAVDAEAAALGFKKVGGTLSTEASQAATLSLIMKQTADAHGAFGRESGTVAQWLQILGAQWENLTAKLGTAFLPIVSQVLGTISQLAEVLVPVLVPAITQLAAWFGQLVAAAGQLVQWLGQQLVPIWAELVAWWQQATAQGGALSEMFAGLVGPAQQIWQTLVGLVQAILPVAAAIGAALMPALAQLLPILAQAVADILTLAANLIQMLLPAVQSMATHGLPPLLQSIVTAVAAIGQLIHAIVEVSSSLQSSVPYLKMFSDATWMMLGIVIQAAGLIVKQIANMVEGIAHLVKAFGALLRGDWSALWHEIIAALEASTRLWMPIVQRAVSAIGDIMRSAGHLGMELIHGMVAGIQAGAHWLVSAVKNVCSAAVNAAKSALGIASPSKVFAELGRQTAAGYVAGLDRSQGLVANSVDNLLNQPRRPRPGGWPETGPDSPAGTTIIVQGALDPEAVARQIRSILNNSAWRSGRADFSQQTV